ncbi:TraB/GumN family protein [Sphingomonas sp. HITSZ_GF]|uniref:TraB/GumN family protein n=1 Tax=Sphingomonas sp. HITSZ_GF TaxID=3037247 RepID=UPI00240E373B|nr:TraB/GumN family protein [Sphingomonas sp. HITSZ_GF]MDG2535471.1 TraB/GumN family protein [Sphingomonas sp. HITSZ_GF]
MIRRLLPVILALALWGCGGKAPSDTAADPALWVVKDADTTLYLFGTVHVLKPGLSWFDGGVKAAFDAADTLVLELVMPPDAEMQQIVAELGTHAPGTPLPDELPPVEAAKMRAALPEYGLSPDALDNSDPWLAATMLSVLPLRQLGYDDKQGAEPILTAAAKAQGKKIEGLETARQQLGYFDALPLPAQRKLLIETIDELPNAGSKIDQAVAAWRKGDADGLARLVNEDATSSPEVTEALLVRRNRNWAEWISRRMQRPGTVFVAVGAGHLAGNTSLQNELAKRGLQVERVQY